jgi:hypothetical protein
MYPVDEWSGGTAGFGNCWQVSEDSLHLLLASELGVDDKGLHTSFDKRETFRPGPTPDVRVRLQSRPALSPTYMQPIGVRHLLIGGYAIVFGQSNDVNSRSSQATGYNDTSQAAIKKELRKDQVGTFRRRR